MGPHERCGLPVLLREGKVLVDRTIFILPTAHVAVSSGQLSGVTQGTGAHLLGQTITLKNNKWEAVNLTDSTVDSGRGSSASRTGLEFSDNDGRQRLNGEQTIDGVTYADRLVIENEFALIVRDPDGNLYRLLVVNIRESQPSSATFATVEGLAFVSSSTGGSAGGFPPINVPLTVLQNIETPSDTYASLAAPPCFVAGTQILTPDGYRLIDDLAVGDLVMTLDHGAQPIRWVGVARLPMAVLVNEPKFRPVTIKQDAFAAGCPHCDLQVSPQHRILVTGWQAELLFGEGDVLVPAIKLVNDGTIRSAGPDGDVTYIHLMFDCHEVIWADGLASESFLPGLVGASDAPDTRAEQDALFPQMATEQVLHLTARPCISDKRTRLLRDSLTH